ncbi:MAG: flgK [Rhodoferax sp.]|nr:flgK [Rhodoferax sp.]
MSMINNALSGSLAAQAALSVASQNVANLMTPGYTRQGILLTAMQPSRTGAFAAGDGVATPSLFRFADDYKSLQMWQAASSVGEFGTAQPYLTQLEQVMGDDTSTINSGMDAFFSALNAASVEPTSTPLRQQVISAAEALAVRFNSLNQVLANQRSAVYQQRTTTVGQVNTLAADIAKLNQKIASATALGASPSGLMDERDNKIDAMAKLVGVNVISQADGTRNVSLRNGAPLVVGSTAASIKVTTAPDGTQGMAIEFAKETFAVPTTDLGGELGGLGNFENDVLTPLKQSISDMAAQLTTAFNTQLGAGFAMDGSPGVALFQLDTTSVSALLTVTAGIKPQDLAFSSNATLPGDSGNLLKLIGVKSQPVTVGSLGSVLLGDAYTQLVSRLGTDSQQNAGALSVSETVRTYAESNWKSTSGVNEDEEAVNIIQYQQMYQANMKVIAVANSLFDATLAMMG